MFNRSSILFFSVAGVTLVLGANASCGSNSTGFGDGGTDGGGAGGSGGTSAGAGGSFGTGGTAGAGGSTATGGAGGTTATGGAGGTTATGGAGGTGGTGGAGGTGGTASTACSATSTGGIATLPGTGPGGYQPTDGGTAIGIGGYSFTFNDGVAPAGTGNCTASPTTICIDQNAMCVMGMTGVASTTTPYPCYGGGFGFNVGQMSGSMTAGTFSVPSTSTGLTYALSNIPSGIGGLRIQVVTGTAPASATNSYCAPITAATGTVPWTSLELTCYDTPVGTALTGPPMDLQQIEISIDDGTAAGAFNFCLDSISF
jgi:hypothetical protein